MRTTITAIALTGLMLLVPMAMGQGQEITSDADSGYEGGPVEITLYQHIFNLLDKKPMNTQPMDEAAPDLAQGYSFPTIQGTPESVPVSNPNFLYMYNSPGPVHYNVSLKEPKFHPERGLAEDLQLAGSEMTLYWYMSADATENIATGDQGPDGGAMPQVTVRATMRLGDDIGGNLDDGQIVAQGEQTLDIVQPPGAANVTEFQVPMSIQTNTIPKDESFNVKVEWFQMENGEMTFMDSQWQLHTGTEYPNRIVTEIANPIRLNYVHPEPIGDRKIAIHTAFVTPFGNYDVDLDQLDFTLTNEDGETITPQSLQGPIITQKSWVHNHHFEPVLATWVWNYRADDAAAGTYDVRVQTANYQGSAVAEKTASFTLQEEGKARGFSSSGDEVLAQDEADESTDGAPLGILPLVIALLAATAAVRFRDRRR